MKAAEDSRTPRPRGRSGMRSIATASWSAAVLCRFGVHSLAGSYLCRSTEADLVKAPSRRRLPHQGIYTAALAVAGVATVVTRGNNFELPKPIFASRNFPPVERQPKPYFTLR